LIWAAGFGEPESIEPLLDAHANNRNRATSSRAQPRDLRRTHRQVDAINILVKPGAKT
jgi:hypothetical protein